MRQIEKAKSSRQDSGSESLPPRAVATQDDMLLWLNMLIKETKGQDLVKCLTDPKYNALHALKDGFETICSTMMDYLMDLGAWDEFYTICKAIFENGVAFWLVEEHEAKEKAKREAQPKQEKSLEQKAAELMAAMNRLSITSPQELKKAKLADESIATRTVVKDWKMWENFIIAASKQPNAKKWVKSFLVTPALPPRMTLTPLKGIEGGGGVLHDNNGIWPSACHLPYSTGHCKTDHIIRDTRRVRVR